MSFATKNDNSRRKSCLFFVFQLLPWLFFRKSDYIWSFLLCKSFAFVCNFWFYLNGIQCSFFGYFFFFFEFMKYLYSWFKGNPNTFRKTQFWQHKHHCHHHHHYQHRALHKYGLPIEFIKTCCILEYMRRKTKYTYIWQRCQGAWKSIPQVIGTCVWSPDF